MNLKQIQTKQNKQSCGHALTERTTIPVINQSILTALLVNQSDCVIFVLKFTSNVFKVLVQLRAWFTLGHQLPIDPIKGNLS